MSDPLDPARPLTVLRARGLGGRFHVPADPNLFCLAAMLGAVARGETVLFTNAAEPDPNLVATLGLLRALGVRIEVSDDRWQIDGLGPLGLLAPARALDFTNAGRVLPLAMGLVAPYGFTTRLAGLAESAVAPLGLIERLRALGTEVREGRGGRLPISLKGPKTLIPQVGRLPSGALEAKAALLLSALALPGTSSFLEDAPGPDHPERLFRHFGAIITDRPGDNGSHTLDIAGLPALGARTLALAGAPDVAALAVLAALIVPASDVLVEDVWVNPARTVVLSTLRQMGGHISVLDRRQAAGEDVADLHVRHSPLLGIEVEPAGLSLGDIVLLAIAGSFAAGETRLPKLGFEGEAELRRMLIADLSANNAVARLEGDALIVARPEAGRRLGGAVVNGMGGPLYTAAFMTLGLAAAEQVTIADDAAMETAYPGLIRSFEALGAEFHWGWAA
ncbi:MAG TPA: hypothetical protein VL418_14435 [Devosiaceae bacterium]|nr:hypothetical protein [Devosiaceae bacterium]